eukprot:5174242-Pleurochrysis_carterae.AAC.1
MHPPRAIDARLVGLRLKGQRWGAHWPCSASAHSTTGNPDTDNACRRARELSSLRFRRTCPSRTPTSTCQRSSAMRALSN